MSLFCEEVLTCDCRLFLDWFTFCARNSARFRLRLAGTLVGYAPEGFCSCSCRDKMPDDYVFLEAAQRV